MSTKHHCVTSDLHFDTHNMSAMSAMLVMQKRSTGRQQGRGKQAFHETLCEIHLYSDYRSCASCTRIQIKFAEGTGSIRTPLTIGIKNSKEDCHASKPIERSNFFGYIQP